MAFSARLKRNRPLEREPKETFMLKTHFRDDSRPDEEELTSWDDLLDEYDDRAPGPHAEEGPRDGVSYVSLVMRAWGGDA